MTRSSSSTKSKITKSAKARATGTAKRIAAVITSVARRARAEVKGRSKARRTTTRKVRGASRAVKTVARRKGGRAKK